MVLWSVPQSQARTLMADMIQLTSFSALRPPRFSPSRGLALASPCPLPRLAWSFAPNTALQRGAFRDIDSRFRVMWLRMEL